MPCESADPPTCRENHALRVRWSADLQRPPIWNYALRVRWSADLQRTKICNPNGKNKCFNLMKNKVFTCRCRGLGTTCSCDSTSPLTCRGRGFNAFLTCRCRGSQTPCTCKWETTSYPLPLRLHWAADLQEKGVPTPPTCESKFVFFSISNLDCIFKHLKIKIVSTSLTLLGSSNQRQLSLYLSFTKATTSLTLLGSSMGCPLILEPQDFDRIYLTSSYEVIDCV